MMEKSEVTHTVECVKYLDKELQWGHLKPFKANWKRVWMHVSATEQAFTRFYYMVICSLDDFRWKALSCDFDSNLATGESGTNTECL